MKTFTFVCAMLITALLLAACGRPTSDSAARPTGAPLPTAPVSPISPLPGPPLTPETETPDLAELRAQVAQQMNLPATALTVVASEEVTWPDTSLGCPQPDMMYAQVLTPGWRVVFVDTDEREYQVHTTDNYKQFVICTPSPQATLPLAYRDNPAVEAAIQTLVAQKGVAATSVTVVNVAAVEWPDSCLGCAGPEEVCLMVITPGRRIVLESGGVTYTLHTDRTGRHVILCTQPGRTPPGADS